MKIGIFGQDCNNFSKELFLSFFKYLSSKNIIPIVYYEFKSKIQNVLSLDISNINTFNILNFKSHNVNFLFSFGGDGTIIKASKIVKDTNIPIIGVNTGNLGFLSTISSTLFMKNIDNIINKKYNIIPRSLIKVQTSCNDYLKNNLALNEVAISRMQSGKMIYISVYIEEDLLSSFWSDGVIISTPTGSTGYSLSCGGPILHPINKSLIITPIAAHNLNCRPIVIPDFYKLRINVRRSGSSYYNLSIDSDLIKLKVETDILLEVVNFKINLVNMENITYFDTLRNKMFWGLDNRRFY